MTVAGAAWLVLAGAFTLVAYAYVGYPILLLGWGWLRRRTHDTVRSEAAWPSVSIMLPVYNEEATLARTLERLLALDYPSDRRQILVISDASTDGTDAIARAFADRGVELLRLPQRRGKTAAENAAVTRLRSQIVVNTDASIRIPPDALKPLIAAFADATVGVASGRDVSIAQWTESSNRGESGYVGYEMWVRDLETRAGGIVGASGCFFATRAHLRVSPMPEALSWDFAAALIAREHGYRAVSVNEAVCYVPRTQSLRREYRRKVRTMTRGMETLRYKRHLLNPLRFGSFAWKLFSHKLCRWLVPWGGLAGLVSLGILAASEPRGRWLGIVVVAAGSCALLGWTWPERVRMPRVLAWTAYLLSGNLATLEASIRALRGEPTPLWEPTRRDAAQSPAPSSG